MEVIKIIGIIFLLISLLFGCSGVEPAIGIKGRVKIVNTEINDNFILPESENLTQRNTEEETGSQILVQFKTENKEEIHKVLTDYNLELKDEIEKFEIKVLAVGEEVESGEIIKKLKEEEIIEAVSLNHRLQLMGAVSPADDYYDKQWYCGAISLPEAWGEVQGTGAEEVTVAVVDTGVDLDHLDLVDNLVPGKDIASGNTTDDFIGHGTHVAGIIGAVGDNDRGVAGINWDINIMPVKISSGSLQPTIYMSDVVEGIIWAADQDVDIINLSIGSPFPNKFLKEAVNYAQQQGAMIVAAAGNGGYDKNNIGDPEVIYPARYQDVISVGALDHESKLTFYSNYGREIDFVAPGDYIFSTVKGDSYEMKSGTSMAAPQVAGLAALIMATTELTTQAEVEKRIQLTAQDLGNEGWDLKYGFGLINAHAAVAGAEITKAQVFAGEREGKIIVKKSEVVSAGENGSYNLSDVDSGSWHIYSWIDVDENDKINTGDYFGRTSSKIVSGVNINFNLQLIKEENFELEVG